jgi:hypothetical protein
VRDLPETPGPIVAATREYLDVFIRDVELNAITVELDFMERARVRRIRETAP